MSATIASTSNFTAPSCSENLALPFSLMGDPLAPTNFEAFVNMGLSTGFIDSKTRDETMVFEAPVSVVKSIG